MSEFGVIKGSGDSKSLKKGHSSAISEQNSFISTEQKKGDLLNRKATDSNFILSDLIVIANDSTFEELAFYLVC